MRVYISNSPHEPSQFEYVSLTAVRSLGDSLLLC